MSHVIEVSHLTKDYGQGRGVYDVSFHVDKGECFGFLGPNGAGKSTTIRHLMGFSNPDKGQTFRARISKNTFYNNFNDKDDVLDLLLERYRLLLVSKIRPELDGIKDKKTFFRTIIREVVHFFKEAQLPFEKILRSNNNHSLLYSVNVFIQKTLLEAKREYEEFFSDELDSPASSFYYGGAFASLIFFSYKNNYDVGEEKMNSDILKLIFNE